MIAEDSASPHLTSDSAISSNSPCCKTWWPPLACPGLPFRSLSLDFHRPYSRFHTMHMQCERVWQKMSRAFFTPFGKRCHVFLPMILAKDVANISRQEVTLLSKLYLLSSPLTMWHRK